MPTDTPAPATASPVASASETVEATITPHETTPTATSTETPTPGSSTTQNSDDGLGSSSGTPNAERSTLPVADGPSSPVPIGPVDDGTSPPVPPGYQAVGQPKYGGMACVYKAYQASLDRYVAIKVMAPALARDPVFVQRFSDEAKRTAKLEHPNIVTIYDSGRLADGTLFIAMRYVDGMSLQELLAREGALPVARAVDVVTQVAAALGFAHARGIVHRDVKPSNVMVEPGDRATLTDFGIAKVIDETQMGHSRVLGTPKYLAPEQASGKPIDHRADLYSLGIMLYELLVGRAPFEAATPLALLHAHVSLLPPHPRQLKPELSEDLAAVVLKAMAKDPDQRYQSADEFSRALRRVGAEETRTLHYALRNTQNARASFKEARHDVLQRLRATEPGRLAALRRLWQGDRFPILPT